MDKKCNFNDNCSKAKRIVEEANKDLKYFYVEVPTGPKGEAGPEGPQGLPGQDGKNPITAYGMRYSTTSSPMTFNAGAEITIPLADKGSFVNVYLNTNDSIVIKESGIYLISIFI